MGALTDAFLLDSLKLFGLIGLIIAGVLQAVLLFHELGHLFAARLVGIGISEISLGVGRVWFSGMFRSGTRWSVRRIPIAAFVALEEGTGTSSAFEAHSFLHRAFVVLGGPLANLLGGLATLAALYIFLGAIVNLPVVVGIDRHGPAAQAGMMLNDRIVSVAGRPVSSSSMVKKILRRVPGQAVSLQVDRGGKMVTLSVTPRSEPGDILSFLFKPLGEIGVLMGSGHRVSVLRIQGIQGLADPVETSLFPVLRGRLADMPASGGALALSVYDPLVNRVRDLQILVFPQVNACLSEEVVRRPWACPLAAGNPLSQVAPFDTVGAAFAGLGRDIFNYVTLSTWDVLLDPSRMDSETLSRGLRHKVLNFSFLEIARHPALLAASIVLMFVGISLGVGAVNLLPFPMLDGFHLLVLGMERGLRRPLSPRGKAVLTLGSFALLGVVMVCFFLLRGFYTFF